MLPQTCRYQSCKRPNNQNRFGSTFGPDPALGGPVFTFRTACYYRSFAKSLDFGVQKKRSRGLCDFAASTARVGRFPKPLWKGGGLFCSFKHANPSCGGREIAEPTVSFFWTPKSSDLRRRPLVRGGPKSKNWAPGGGFGPQSWPKTVLRLRPFALLVTACLKDQKRYPAL